MYCTGTSNGAPTSRPTAMWCALAAHAPTPVGRTWAAYLSIGQPAAVSGISAALLHHIPDIADSGEVTLIVPMSRRAPRRPGLAVQRIRDWSGRCWTTRAGLPVTSLADTVIDLSTLYPPARTQAILEQLLWRRLSVAEITGRLGRGRPGSAAVRRALHDLSDGHRSVAERRVAAGLRRRRVPAFSSNIVMQDRHGPVAEVDFLWRRLRVAVQVDG